MSGTIVLRYGTSKEWTETPAETAVQASVAHVAHLFSKTNKYERRRATWMREGTRVNSTYRLFHRRRLWLLGVGVITGLRLARLNIMLV